MQITIPLVVEVDPAGFNNLVSTVDADGRRTINLELVRTNIPVEAAPNIGVTITANTRIQINSVISRAEIAALLGVTEEVVANMSGEYIAQNSPFTLPQLQKILAAMASDTAQQYSDMWPSQPWKLAPEIPEEPVAG
jgi:hypothetical protein